MPQDKIHPPYMKSGDKIALLAPASPFDIRKWDRAVDFIKSRGFEPIWNENVFSSQSYLAGSDELRSSEFMKAWLDPEVKAVIAVRGGYGTMRLLDHLDFDLISKNPKPFIGFSDNTALHMALSKQAGLVSIHGPHFLTLPDLPENTADRYFDLLTNTKAPGACCNENLKVLREGKAEGKLYPANLTMLTHLTGTPYMPELEGAILVLEDVNEEAYKVDRALTHLALTGVFDLVSGVILGAFTHNTNQEALNGQVEDRILELTQKRGLPVMASLPVGHIDDNHPLPCGVNALMDTEARTLELLEAAVK